MGKYSLRNHVWTPKAFDLFIYIIIYFSDIDINTMPILSRSTDLQVKAPNIDDVLSEVRHGQLIQLRIIYDNTANNSK